MRNSQPIKPAQISEQVSKIVRTEQFRGSRILSDFLKFIIKETLNGNEQSLKEYVIATEVLKKSSDFNPQLDAVVRIHARRLRKFLENYYSSEGANDPIQISIPKGRYIPHFARKEGGSLRNRKVQGSSGFEDHEDELPTISVLPFKCLNPNERSSVVCSVLAKHLSIELSHFRELKVISSHSSEVAQESLNNWDELMKHLGTDYVLEGSCFMQGESLSVGIELHQVSEKQIIWAESMVIKDFSEDIIFGFDGVIRSIVARICGFFGIIYRKALNDHVPRQYNTLYAIYWHNNFHQNFSAESFQECMEAVEKALAANPKDALLNALKAELLLNLCAMDMEGDTNCFMEGSELAKKAVSYNSNEQHGWQVLGWSKLLSKDPVGYLRASEKCIAINPNNPWYTGAVGFGHQCAGNYEPGLELMLNSIDLNPYYHWVINLGLTMYYMHKKEYNEALYWAELIKRPGLLWDPLYRISLLGHLNRKDETADLIEHLYALSPNFNERSSFIVNRFTCDQKLVETILEGLHKAGVDIVQDS